MARSPVVMVVEWDVASPQVRPVAAALHGVMLSTREQRGFLGCSLATEVGARVTLHYEESWATEEALQKQVRSERFAVLCRLIESAVSHPRVEFALPGGKRGFDYAQALRETARVVTSTAWHPTATSQRDASARRRRRQV